MLVFKNWDTFYEIISTASATLIGLMFVVMTLIAQKPREANSAAAFTTPIIVHLGIILLLSALLSIPWGAIIFIALLCGLIGLFGFIYSIIVIKRIQVQVKYKPGFEDWLFYVLLPLIAYITLSLSPIGFISHIKEGIFCVGFAILLLLLVSIRNAWDTVFYFVFKR